MVTKPNEIAVEILRKHYSYDPVTGLFTRADGKILKGEPCKRGLALRIDGKRYAAHRCAYALMTGAWPVHLIDHEDTDFTNNKWENLRDATQSQNLANTKTPVTNTSGFKGVHWAANVGKWRARIKHDGKQVHLGLHDTREAAHAAYFEGARRLKGEFARAA